MRKRTRRVTSVVVTMVATLLLASGAALPPFSGLSESSVAIARPSPNDHDQTAQSHGAQQERPETLSGVFHATYVDPIPGSNGEPSVEYVLSDDRGRWTELSLDEGLAEPLGGVAALNRERVEVEGTGASDGERVEVESIRPEEAVTSRAAPRSEEARGLHGSQPFLTLGCRFADSTGVTPQKRGYYEGLMGSSKPGMDHYWSEVSYDTIDLAGSEEGGGIRFWYDLPHPQSYYKDSDPGNVFGYDMDKLAIDCTAAAEADVFFPKFHGINLMFNQDMGDYAMGGGTTLTRDGQTLDYGTTWIGATPEGDPETIHKITAHEMGHTFGLMHSSGSVETPDGPYDSRWDVMSRGGVCKPPDPLYGCVAPHTIAFHKDQLGWIPATRKYVANPGADRGLTIERLGVPLSDDHLMAEIPIRGSAAQFYTVEARRFAGYDEQIPGEGVVIHKVDLNFLEAAEVMDADRDGDHNDEGATWLPGETFTDPTNGISIEVTGETASGYGVRVANNGRQNVPPRAAADAFTTAEGQTLTIPAPGMLANDADADGDRVFLHSFRHPGHGTLDGVWDDGEFTYTPDPGFAGTDTFTYVASDGFDLSNVATVTIRVGTRNTAPTITSFRPAPSSSTRDRTPTIGATVRDNTELSRANVRLYIDGKATSFAYSQRTDRLVRTTGKLRYGLHTVRVVATDGELTTARVWRFRVVRQG